MDEVKLIVAESLEGEKHEFLIFINQKVGEGGFGVVKKAIQSDKPYEELAVKIISFKDEMEKKKI
jgi:hypothetical protein